MNSSSSSNGIVRRRPRPAYATHRPSLDLSAVLRAVARGGCDIRWERAGAELGGAWALVQPNIHLLVEYWFGETSHQIEIPLSEMAAGAYGKRKTFLCPKCGAKVMKLFYRRKAWNCLSCHDLTYASKYAGVNEAKERELVALERSLMFGRKKHERSKSYQKKMKRRDALRAELGPGYSLTIPDDSLTILAAYSSPPG